MKPRLCTAIVVGLAIALLLASRPPVSAQPVATIALPAPGGTEQLYAGCNNISLTFPDATPSQTVAQAVTPAGTVETLWRFNGPLNRFEGFSPAYPQASDLTSVNFLDAVWLCMTEAPPGGVAPPAPAPPTPTPPAQVIPPAPLPVTAADIVPTDLYPDNQPMGVMWVRITNNGPDTLANSKVAITLSQSRSTFGNPPVVDTYTGPATEYTLNLAPGQTQTINLGAQIDTSHYRYDFTVTAAAVDFTDPNTGNDTYKESVEPMGATLNLTNQSGASIDSVQFTVSGDPWGENRLMFGEVVANGQTRTWLITAGTYDLRAYIGDQVLDERLNVGISGTYDWTVQAALDIHNSTWSIIEGVHIGVSSDPNWGPQYLNPGETIPPWGVRRFHLAPGSYTLQVKLVGDGLRAHFDSAVAGVCAWFVPDDPLSGEGVFTCAP
jgi:Domain of unknown function DUF11